MRLREFPSVFRQAAIAWWNDDVFRLSASLAFYTVFSLAPIMLLSVVVAGIVFGEETAARQLVVQVESLVGKEGGRVVREMVTSLGSAGGGPLAAVFGIVSLLIGSTVVFAELQSALNKIWDVRADPTEGMVRELARKRLLSFVIVIGVGFLLLVALVVDAVLAGAQELIASWVPLFPWVWQVVNQVVFLAITTLLFMLIYKVLPDVQIAWRDVFTGALVTAVLFAVGKRLIGLYLGNMSVGSAYGAAGSFVVFLVWIYYTALVSFFGAEFTNVYARRQGSGVRPESHAVPRHEKDGQPSA